MEARKCRWMSSINSGLLRTEAYRMRGTTHWFSSKSRSSSTMAGFAIFVNGPSIVILIFKKKP